MSIPRHKFPRFCAHPAPACYQFTELVTKAEDLVLEYDAMVADGIMLTTQLMWLEYQFTQTLALIIATTINNIMKLLANYRNGQTNHDIFTGEDHSNLRSFVAVIGLHLIIRP
jgi:hypothetical protein